jgi:hypothetical protein
MQYLRLLLPAKRAYHLLETISLIIKKQMSIVGKNTLTVTASGLPMPVTVSNVSWNGLSFKSSGTLFGQSYTATGTASGNTITGEAAPPKLIPLVCAPKLIPLVCAPKLIPLVCAPKLIPLVCAPKLIPLACASSYPALLTCPQAKFATPALPPCAATSTELPNKHPITRPQPRALFAPAIKRSALLRHARAPFFFCSLQIANFFAVCKLQISLQFANCKFLCSLRKLQRTPARPQNESVFKQNPPSSL